MGMDEEVYLGGVAGLRNAWLPRSGLTGRVAFPLPEYPGMPWEVPRAAEKSSVLSPTES